jgi:hypothetical protein
MNRLGLLADQLYIWSDTHAPSTAQTAFCGFAPTSPTTAAPAATPRSSVARFPHRALQTLRQAGMQMRPRPRSRAQVLPLAQSLWAATANGLHPPGLLPPDRRICNPLPAAPPDRRRDLCHQSRAVMPPRAALRFLHEPSSPCSVLGSLRCGTGRDTARHYALCLARWRGRP